MTSALVWTEPARRDLSGLSLETRQRITRAVERFAGAGHGDIKKLAGSGGEWRLRVGDYRIRFARTPGTILILRVRHRREAYRDRLDGPRDGDA